MYAQFKDVFKNVTKNAFVMQNFRNIFSAFLMFTRVINISCYNRKTIPVTALF